MSKARTLADLLSTGGILEDGIVSATEIDGVTSDSTELNLLDGVTATTDEINRLDVTTLGTAENSKVLTTSGTGYTTIPSSHTLVVNGNLATGSDGLVDINSNINFSPSSSTKSFSFTTESGGLRYNNNTLSTTGVNLGYSNMLTVTATGNFTVNTGNINISGAHCLLLLDAAGYSVTWNISPLVWINNAGTAPSIAPSGTYTSVFFWSNGTTVFGATVGNGT